MRHKWCIKCAIKGKLLIISSIISTYYWDLIKDYLIKVDKIIFQFVKLILFNKIHQNDHFKKKKEKNIYFFFLFPSITILLYFHLTFLCRFILLSFPIFIDEHEKWLKKCKQLILFFYIFFLFSLILEKSKFLLHHYNNKKNFLLLDITKGIKRDN